MQRCVLSGASQAEAAQAFVRGLADDGSQLELDDVAELAATNNQVGAGGAELTPRSKRSTALGSRNRTVSPMLDMSRTVALCGPHLNHI